MFVKQSFTLRIVRRFTVLKSSANQLKMFLCQAPKQKVGSTVNLSEI